MEIRESEHILVEKRFALGTQSWSVICQDMAEDTRELSGSESTTRTTPRTSTGT